VEVDVDVAGLGEDVEEAGGGGRGVWESDSCHERQEEQGGGRCHITTTSERQGRCAARRRAQGLGGLRAGGGVNSLCVGSGRREDDSRSNWRGSMNG
jgi:hypothetical protein